MQRPEWDKLAVVLENGWRGEWDDLRSDAYFALLADFATADVERALQILARNGSPFIPAVPEIIAAIDSGRQAATPMWPEAWALIRRVVRRRGRSGEAAALADLQAASPLVASFVHTYGWGRLCSEPVDDPQWGQATLRRLEQAFGEWVERQQDRERQGLAIEAVSRRSLSGPRRVDAAALLPKADAA